MEKSGSRMRIELQNLEPGKQVHTNLKHIQSKINRIESQKTSFRREAGEVPLHRRLEIF